MAWLAHPVQLQGKHVSLIPLAQSHVEALLLLAPDKRIWEHYVVDGSNTNALRSTLAAALQEREAGKQYPFVIVKTGENKIIGSTRFLDLQPAHRKLEIGWTWLQPRLLGHPC